MRDLITAVFRVTVNYLPVLYSIRRSSSSIGKSNNSMIDADKGWRLSASLCSLHRSEVPSYITVRKPCCVLQQTETAHGGSTSAVTATVNEDASIRRKSAGSLYVCLWNQFHSVLWDADLAPGRTTSCQAVSNWLEFFSQFLLP